jgi:pimeloyl-ACP methyl ester carboxylesterase
MTPIVLIPGLICTAELFAPQLPALWPHGPVTVASTLEGETMERIAAGVLRDAPPRFALGGLSMGGYVALEILRQAPDRVLKLALMDSTARPDAPEQTRLRRAMIQKATTGGYEDVLAQTIPNLVHPSRRKDTDLIETQTRMGRAIGLDGFVRQQTAIMNRIDSRPFLWQIKVPTLVVVGDKDALTPPERAQEMADAVAGARLVVVPECGHVSTLERPEVVNTALVEWLSA